MSFSIDSNSPYFTELPLDTSKNAVFMTAEDSRLGTILAVIYKTHSSAEKLSAILIAAHGTSGFVNMTLDPTSKFYGACKCLAPSHFNSPVRKALAVAALRTYTTCDKPLRRKLYSYYDESYAGALGSSFRLICGKFPQTIGQKLIDSGLLSAKNVSVSAVDIIYEDQLNNVDLNNELIYLIGEQLDQFMDPLTEYHPEKTDKLYLPLQGQSLETETKEVQDLCEDLYLLEAKMWSELLELLQKTIIPLRLEVLRGSFKHLNISKLNQVFPPTIDELFRIQNLIYESLKTSLPLGAFEVIRACGTTIPYFYRAGVRHVAATKFFSPLFRELINEFPEISEYLKLPTKKIEEIVTNIQTYFKSSLTLIEQLIDQRTWETSEQVLQVNEFRAAIEETLQPFKNSSENSNSNGILQFMNNLVVNCPKELHAQESRRRLVTVFEVEDLFENLNMFVVMFNDVVLLLKPQEEIPRTTLHGLHIPQPADIMTNIMFNNADLPENMPKFECVSWSYILDTYFASYNNSECLHIFSSSMMGSYKLVGNLQPNNLISLLAKAKISTKSEPFYLFQIDGLRISLLSAVHEAKSYNSETSKNQVAVFLSKKLSDTVFYKHDIYAAISVNFDKGGSTTAGTTTGSSDVILDTRTRQGYRSTTRCSKADLQTTLANEIAYLSTLSLSSQNELMLDTIISGNKSVSKRLVEWASILEKPRKSDKHKGTSSRAQSQTQPQRQRQRQSQTQPQRQSQAQSQAQSQRHPQKQNSVHSSLHSSVHTPADKPIQHGAELFANLKGHAGQKSIAESAITTNSFITEDVDFGSDNTSYSEDISQKHVDDWLHQLKHNRDDEASLSSNDESFGVPMKRDAFSWRTESSFNSDLQIGGFLDHPSSSLYNSHAGTSFPRLDSQISAHKQLIDENDFEAAKIGNEDFSYLAPIVERSDVGSLADSPVKSLEKRTMVRDGSMVFGSKYSLTSAPSMEPLQVSRSLRYLSTIVDKPSEETHQDLSTGHTHTDTKSGTNGPNDSPDDDPDDDLDFDFDAGPGGSSGDSPGGNDDQSESAGDRSQQIAKDWLLWTKSRPASMMPVPEFNEPAENHLKPKVPPSESVASFRKMVMSSSLHTLQLASYVAQIDQKVYTSSPRVAEDLTRLKSDLEEIYKLQSTSTKQELMIRKRLCGIHQLFIKYDLHALANGLMEIEWIRRSRVLERHGSIADDLWKLQ